MMCSHCGHPILMAPVYVAIARSDRFNGKRGGYKLVKDVE